VGGLILLAFFLGHMLKQTDPREIHKAYTQGCLSQLRGQQQGGWSQSAQQPQPSDYGQPQQVGQAGLVSYDPNNPVFGQMM